MTPEAVPAGPLVEGLSGMAPEGAPGEDALEGTANDPLPELDDVWLSEAERRDKHVRAEQGRS